MGVVGGTKTAAARCMLLSSAGNQMGYSPLSQEEAMTFAHQNFMYEIQLKLTDFQLMSSCQAIGVFTPTSCPLRPQGLWGTPASLSNRTTM